MLTRGLILCVLALGSASCGSSHAAQEPTAVHSSLASGVDKHIKDPERQEKVLGLLQELDDVVFAYSGNLVEHQKKLTELDGNYNATPDEFDALWDENERQRRDVVAKYISVRLRMRAEMSEDEWVAVNNALSGVAQ